MNYDLVPKDEADVDSVKIEEIDPSPSPEIYDSIG